MCTNHIHQLHRDVLPITVQIDTGMNRQKRPGGRGGSRPSHPRVPPLRSINHGTPVNIVLKVDQPTGRTVSGTVDELLTRGDHPRGVKVRLTDGRVGRVQSLRSADEPTDSTQDAVEGREEGIQLRTEGAGITGGRRDRFTARDMRLDGPEEPSSEPLGLDMYIRPPKGKKRGGKTRTGQNSNERDDALVNTTATPETTIATTATASCPVCGSFEGDEAAVAHHVAQHFEE